VTKGLKRLGYGDATLFAASGGFESTPAKSEQTAQLVAYTILVRSLVLLQKAPPENYARKSEFHCSPVG